MGDGDNDERLRIATRPSILCVTCAPPYSTGRSKHMADTPACILALIESERCVAMERSECSMRPNMCNARGQCVLGLVSRRHRARTVVPTLESMIFV